MRFRRRTAVPVTERAAAGVLCLVPCFFRSPLGQFCLHRNLDIPQKDKKGYEDETRHRSSGGTDGGAGC